MILAALALLVLLAPPPPLRLESFVLDSPARVTQRHTTDFDGDGLSDVLLLSNREARVHFQRAGAAAFETAADLAFDLPADTILFDTGDVLGDAATREIVCLRPGVAEAISLAGRRLAPPPVPLVAGLAHALRPDPAEAHWRPLCRDFDGAPGDELFLPGAKGIDLHRREPGSAAFVPAGTAPVGVAGSIEAGSESLLSLFRASFGYPALHLADADGDGALDVAAATIESIALHRGSRAAPFFGAAPPRTFRTGVEARRDRPAPATPLLFEDVDGDGRADLVIVDGAAGTLRIHDANASGNGAGATPRQVLKIEGWILEAALRDVNGDGRADLVLLSTPEVGVVEGARIVMEKSLRVRVAAFAAATVEKGSPAPFERTPFATFERAVPVAFSTGGASRFEMISAPRPSLGGDFDGDGMTDLLAPVDAGALGIFLGSRGLAFSSEPAATIALPPGDSSRANEAWIRDLNGDGRTDIVLFQPDFERRGDRVTLILARP